MIKMATKLLLVSMLGLVSAGPVGFFHSKTVAFNSAPAVVSVAQPPTRYVDVDVVQVDKSDVIDQVNHSTGHIVGIIGNIANAIGAIVSQTVRDIGELARTARPVTAIRKTVSVPVQPIVSKNVSVYVPVATKTVNVPPPAPQPSITKTIPVPTVQFQTVQKTIG